MQITLQAKRYTVTLDVSAEAADPDFEAEALTILSAIRGANLSSNFGRLQAASGLGELLSVIFRSGLSVVRLNLTAVKKGE